MESRVRSHSRQYQCVPNIPVSGEKPLSSSLYLELFSLCICICISICPCLCPCLGQVSQPPSSVCSQYFSFWREATVLFFIFGVVFSLYLYFSLHLFFICIFPCLGQVAPSSVCPQHSCVRRETTKMPVREKLGGMLVDAYKKEECC